MYSLTRAVSPQRLVTTQAPSLAIAWIVAELYYKLGSFTLELAAFFATWFVTDLALVTVTKLLDRRRP